MKQSDALNINEFREYFGNVESFTNNDIFKFYRKSEPEIKPSTVNWRIYELNQQNVIHRIGRGLYQMGSSNEFMPIASKKLLNINRTLKKNFPFGLFCSWNTSIVTQFQQHISNSNFFIIETEKDISSSIFEFLNFEFRNYRVIYKPNEFTMENYAFGFNNVIIVKDLITEAPIQTVQGYNSITIEKLLVDLFVDKTIFQMYQGNELKHIFKNAFEKYTVNINKLLRYANRRGAKKEIEDYVNLKIGKTPI